MIVTLKKGVIGVKKIAKFWCRAALEWAQEQGLVNNYREIADELEVPE